ncbi:MAG: hypothetical protein ACJ76M_13680, partial [Solirubrobacteraceae bacterium]
VEDALLVGALETGVPLWAIDADRLDGPLGVRAARTGERLGNGELAPDLPAGRLVVADARRPLAVLLGAVADGDGPGPKARRLCVFAVRVAGVPQLHVEDALLVGALETGVPLWALDASHVDGPLGVRAARDGERLGEGELAPDLPPGRLVVADARRPLAILLGAVAEGDGPAPGARRLRVFAVRVAGVPAVHVEEALWASLEALQA